MKQFILVLIALVVPVMANELDRSTPAKIIWTVNDLSAIGQLFKPKGIGNITAAYFANDAARKPLTIKFNRDASVVKLHVPKNAPAKGVVVLELA